MLKQKKRKLRYIKKILQTKKEQVNFCKRLQEQEIRIIDCKEEKISIIPYSFVEDDVSDIFDYIKNIWCLEKIQMGIGGIISLEKVINQDFELYDGLYTPALNSSSCKKIDIKPKETYLCGYQRGTWDKLPAMYEKMLSFANKNNLKLVGYAYEMGLIEFVISNEEEYITQIMIRIGK